MGAKGVASCDKVGLIIFLQDDKDGNDRKDRGAMEENELIINVLNIVFK